MSADDGWDEDDLKTALIYCQTGMVEKDLRIKELERERDEAIRAGDAVREFNTKKIERIQELEAEVHGLQAELDARDGTSFAKDPPWTRYCPKHRESKWLPYCHDCVGDLQAEVARLKGLLEGDARTQLFQLTEQNARLREENERLNDSIKFRDVRINLLQKTQSKMREPERTILCDIIANGCLLTGPDADKRYSLKAEAQGPTDGLTDWEGEAYRMLVTISKFREGAWEYDDDMGHERRSFSDDEEWERVETMVRPLIDKLEEELARRQAQKKVIGSLRSDVVNIDIISPTDASEPDHCPECKSYDKQLRHCPYVDGESCEEAHGICDRCPLLSVRSGCTNAWHFSCFGNWGTSKREIEDCTTCPNEKECKERKG